MSTLDLDAHTIILEELEKLPGNKKAAGDTIMVCCPFHDDSSPSCGIYAAVGMEIPLGWFNCLGCGENGHWNKLAKHAGLEEIKGWQVIEGSTNVMRAKVRKLDETCLGIKRVTLEGLMKSVGHPSFLAWSDSLEWRGYPGQLIHDVGGQFVTDSFGSKELKCFFPIKVGRKFVGGVKAYLRKQPNALSYVASKGDWAKDQGLFPYHFTQKMIAKYAYNFVVLVEGPRDALRLLSWGIPALAILGTHQFNSKKLSLLERAGAQHIYVMSDNDPAGKKMRILVKNITAEREGMKYHAIRLPEELDKKGNLIKLDPDNAPAEFIREIRSYLKSKHNTKLPRKRSYISH